MRQPVFLKNSVFPVCAEIKEKSEAISDHQYHKNLKRKMRISCCQKLYFTVTVQNSIAVWPFWSLAVQTIFTVPGFLTITLPFSSTSAIDGFDFGFKNTENGLQYLVDIGVLLWLRNRDSNPNKQSQSLSCYRYTIPQCRYGLLLYTLYPKSQQIFTKNLKNFENGKK